MSSDWYLIETPYYTNGTETANFNFDSINGLADVLTDTPLGSDITLCKGTYDNETSTFATEIQTLGIIQNNSPDTITKAWERQLIVPIGTLSDYKYIKANGDLWLIMTKPASNKMYEKVVLYLCNYIAKWQDNNGVIVYKPFFVSNASQYNSGEEGNKTVTIGYNQLLIYTSLDDDTIGFSREKRLFVDYNITNPLPYKVTRLDTVSYSFGESRVLTLVMTEDQYNPTTDRIDLMLCDYITPSPTPPTPVEINITYSGQPQVRVGGANKTFTATSENEITSWTRVCTSEQEDYVVLTPDVTNSKKCKVKCLANDLLIGSSFRLQCTDGTNTGDLLVSIVGGI
jgi:hypothetical protein